MARRKLTAEQERHLVEAYEAWEPNGAVSADELARSFGVTRAGMYGVLARHGVQLKSRISTVDRETVDSIQDSMARAALDHLYHELYASRRRVTQLEDAVGDYLAGNLTRAQLRATLHE